MSKHIQLINAAMAVSQQMQEIQPAPEGWIVSEMLTLSVSDKEAKRVFVVIVRHAPDADPMRAMNEHASGVCVKIDSNANMLIAKFSPDDMAIFEDDREWHDLSELPALMKLPE